MAIQAYIDDSMEKDKVLVLAGYIASAEAWSKFSDKWQERLDHAGWPRFKMAEIAASGSPERMEVAGWFYRAIEDHAEAFIAVAVDIKALKKAVSDVGLRPGDDPGYLENPYILAFRAIQDFAVQYQKQIGITEPIDFIFDERGEEDQVREGYAIFREWCREDLKSLFGRAPRFERDDDFLPLQAADLIAWHARRHWISHRTLNGDVKVTWKQNRDIKGMKLNLDYSEIRRFLSDLKERILRVAAGKPMVTISVTFSSDLSKPKDEPV